MRLGSCRWMRHKRNIKTVVNSVEAFQLLEANRLARDGVKGTRTRRHSLGFVLSKLFDSEWRVWQKRHTSKPLPGSCTTNALQRHQPAEEHTQSTNQSTQRAPTNQSTHRACRYVPAIRKEILQASMLTLMHTYNHRDTITLGLVIFQSLALAGLMTLCASVTVSSGCSLAQKALA